MNGLLYAGPKVPGRLTIGHIWSDPCWITSNLIANIDVNPIAGVEHLFTSRSGQNRTFNTEQTPCRGKGECAVPQTFEWQALLPSLKAVFNTDT